MFERGNTEEFNVRYYLSAPSTINTIEKAVSCGADADRVTALCKEVIKEMEQYKKMVFDRVQELSQAPSHSRVTLKRERRGWGSDSHVYYYLTVDRVFDVDGIQPEEISRATYKGTERNKAIADFKAYQKSHPGIEAVKDIEKGRWEK